MGSIAEAPGESWQNVDAALRGGFRGLPGGSSLTQLLAERRGVRNTKDLPLLTEEQILAWADARHAITGLWPRCTLGRIPGTPGEEWRNVDAALRDGSRGLPGGSSLPRLLARERGVRNDRDLPALTILEILRWADSYHARHGTWPTVQAGPIHEGQGETWLGIQQALAQGLRGLPGGSSLARLLAARRGVRNTKDLSPLTEEQILAWADAHHARTGYWPHRDTGPVSGAAGETWLAIDATLRRGKRGLPGGSSLSRFLAQERGVRPRPHRG